MNRINIENKSPWKEAFLWFFLTIPLGLLPILTRLIVLLGKSKTPSLGDFTDRGEFAIYSVAFFTTAFYIAVKDHKKTTIDFRNIILGTSLLGIIISVIAFTFITATVYGGSPVESPFLRNLISILLSISLFIALIANALDNMRKVLDPLSIKAKENERLKNQFKESGESQ